MRGARESRHAAEWSQSGVVRELVHGREERLHHRRLLRRGHPREGIPTDTLVFILLQHILSEPEEILTLSGQRLPMRLQIAYISFSAHTDFRQTSEFIRNLRPPQLVHQLVDRSTRNHIHLLGWQLETRHLILKFYFIFSLQ